MSKTKTDKEMSYYSFIHHGARVHWNNPRMQESDPDAKKLREAVWIVHSINNSTQGAATNGGDSVVIYQPNRNSGEIVYARELEKVEEDFDKRLTRYFREADMFLLSCLKYANRKIKHLESQIRELNEEKELRRSDRKHYVQEKVYHQQEAEIKSLKAEVDRLGYYESFYLRQMRPEPVNLAENDTPENSIDRVIHTLMGFPKTEPRALDPRVTVVAEDGQGAIFPIENIWYDKERGMVRLTINTE